MTGPIKICGYCAAALALMLASCERVPDSVLTASQIQVTTIPEGAIVRCDDGPPYLSPATIGGLPAGEHLITASKEGYKESKFSVRTPAGQKVALQIPLTPIYGLTLIHSSPQGAEVEINEVSRGKTPLLITDLPVGKHRVVLKHPGFLPKTLELEIKDATPKKLDVALTSDAGQLSVSTQPPGATLSVEGVGAWPTPCIIPRLPVGTHKLSIRLEGYQPYTAEISLAAGEQRVLTVTLTPMPSTISVDSVPAKAFIYLDNSFLGEAPIRRHPVSPGTHTLRAELRGYAPASMTNSVASGENAMFVLRLEKNSGGVIATTQPAGVKIFLDGEFVGETLPQQADLQISAQFLIDLIPEGQHELQFTKEGYFDAKKPVEVSANKTVVLHQTLKKRPVPFEPNVRIRAGPTRDQVYTGIIRERYASGEVLVEIEQGIFRRFRLSDIVIERIGEPEPAPTPPPPQPPAAVPPAPAVPVQPELRPPQAAEPPAPERKPEPPSPPPAPAAPATPQPPAITTPPQPAPAAPAQPKPPPQPVEPASAAPTPPPAQPPAPSPPEIMTGTRPEADEY